MRLESKLWLGSLLLLVALWPANAAAQAIDLADIVGGGDGTGTGSSNTGIDISTGATTPTPALEIVTPTNTFTPAANALVDGVFVPDGGPTAADSIQISSTNLTVTGISDSTGWTLDPMAHTWDHLWNGLNSGVTTLLMGTALGAHANKGITFDLDAIEALHGAQATSFDLTAATGSNLSVSVDYFVFVDGVLVASTSLAGADQTMAFGSVALDPSDRFLTLITSSNGLINNDHSFWLDPTVTVVPEPAHALLLVTGAMVLLAAGRIRIARARPHR